MITRNNEQIEINLKELLLVLLHKIWLIIFIGIVFAVGAGVMSYYLIEPLYTSSTKVYIINRQDETRMTFADIQTGEQLTKDYMILVKSKLITEQVIQELELDMSNSYLAKLIDIVNPPATRILEISVKHTDPEMSKQIADAVTRISAERMVSVMEMEKVNIVEWGDIPSKPSSPIIPLNATMGGLFGVFLVSAIILVIFILNDSIRTTEDIEKYLNITALGTIPFAESKKYMKKMKSKRKVATMAS
ncbi:MAG: capsular exopolysaccharide family [Herbinix sp.]|jgi:capsular polysaccharide biosynthesis protein|nr:capsular exopolysaccharide family [Herbinix sp.]